MTASRGVPYSLKAAIDFVRLMCAASTKGVNCECRKEIHRLTLTDLYCSKIPTYIYRVVCFLYSDAEMFI